VECQGQGRSNAGHQWVLKKGLNGWIGKHGRKVAEFKHDLRKKVRHSVSLDSQIDSAVQKTKKQYLAMGGLYKKIKSSLQ
jgi:ribosomal protein L3